jgi:hypothetical protein
MADFEISFDQIRQTTTGSTTCKVMILFTVLGPKTGIDLVQVYAVQGGAPPGPLGPGGSGNVVDTVDLTTTESQYESAITLPAGVAFTLALCPRSKDNGGLSDQVEGESWETFCVFQAFTTSASDNPATPFITVQQPVPATLNHANQITISWESDDYTDGQVIWGPLANPQQTESSFQPVDKGNVPDYTGTYTADITSNLAGQLIAFTVQVRNSFQDASLWFPSHVVVRSAQNYTSVREFLKASNVALPTGISQYFKGTMSLRALMQI